MKERLASTSLLAANEIKSTHATPGRFMRIAISSVKKRISRILGVFQHGRQLCVDQKRIQKSSPKRSEGIEFHKTGEIDFENEKHRKNDDNLLLFPRDRSAIKSYVVNYTCTRILQFTALKN